MTAPAHPRFGLFDHLDRTGAPTGRILAERLALLEAADRLGFARHHQAEHHGTPLGLAPSPGIFLAAASQRTTRIRLCPMVYPLPLYHPLRLVEEVGMLDQLSGGRLDVGVGKGGSPYELAYYGVDPERAPAMFAEAFAVLRAGVSDGRVRFEGEFYTCRDVPVEVRPLQDPFPPFWYGASSRGSVEWAAREGLHVVAGGPSAELALTTAVYHEARAGSPSAADAPLLGAVRRLVVAETDEEALRLARPAYAAWYDSLTCLWRAFGQAPGRFFPDLDAAIENEVALVGSPATVAEEVARYFETSGCNYFIGAPAFGTLRLEDALRTLELFAGQVMPLFPPSGATSTLPSVRT
jgi:alkanesulfonate monooxygenase SsuD/methylene tetrahydromethanopterin reductase-like flavin-dependent oxidoreductase (luciferase family)